MELLSNVGQILLGAGLLSAVAAYLLRVREQNQQERRELRGLLRLIAGEIARNMTTLKHYQKSPDVVAKAYETIFKTKNWEESRIRLAQLMKSGERFNKIYTYYSVTLDTEESELWKLMSEDLEYAKEQHDKGFYGHLALNRLAAKFAYQAIEEELEQAGYKPDEVRKLADDLISMDLAENSDQ